MGSVGVALWRTYAPVQVEDTMPYQLISPEPSEPGGTLVNPHGPADDTPREIRNDDRPGNFESRG